MSLHYRRLPISSVLAEDRKDRDKRPPEAEKDEAVDGSSSLAASRWEIPTGGRTRGKGTLARFYRAADTRSEL